MEKKPEISPTNDALIQEIRQLRGDVQRFICDNKKIHELTRWKPKVSWKEGVDETLEFFKNL